MFGFLIGIGEAIFGFFQTSVDAIVASLVWAVSAIQATIVLLWNGIKGALDIARIGFGKVWDFFKPIYTDILKPAWQKFWKWFDTARNWLNQTFGPVLKFLYTLRAELLKFWQTYVRPWLDLIDVTRKLASILASLGVTWAKALDQTLADIEDKIEAPFRFLLGKLNEAINVVNTIVGADGLLQRVALIRTLARDYQFAWSAITTPYLAGFSSSSASAAGATTGPKTLDEVVADTQAYLQGDGGPLAGAVDEAAQQFGIYLGS